MSLLPRSALALLLSGAFACGGASQAPVDVLHSYARALREARYADAWRMLSREARESLPYEEFERVARESPNEVRETLRWLDRAEVRTPLTVRLELSSGDAVELQDEHGQWRLDPSALEFYGQRTPRQALRSFERALRRQRWDVLLRFAPRRVAEGLTADALRTAWSTGPEGTQVNSMLEELRIALDDNRPIEVAGERATMTYGRNTSRTAQLVREEGLWRVEDPD